MARHPGKSRCCSPAQPAELFARSGPRSRLIVLATNVATGGTGKCRRQALTDQVRSWELKGELDVEPEIEGVLGADPGIKGIFGGDLEIAGVLVGKYGRTAVGSGAFPLWQSRASAIAMRSRQSQPPTDIAFRIMYIMFKASPGGAGVPFASITLPCQAKKPASPACPSRPGSYGFLHRPIRVLYMTQAIQPQTKPTPATMISSSSKAAPFSP